MTKQDYVLIAKVLNSTKPGLETTIAAVAAYAQWERDCLAFLSHFKMDNARFDGLRFIKACKGKGD